MTAQKRLTLDDAVLLESPGLVCEFKIAAGKRTLSYVGYTWGVVDLNAIESPKFVFSSIAPEQADARSPYIVVPFGSLRDYSILRSPPCYDARTPTYQQIHRKRPDMTPLRQAGIDMFPLPRAYKKSLRAR